MMKILNLYSGIGGNRKLWHNDHEITAVEKTESIANVYKQNFQNDTVIISDAHVYLKENYKSFDFIWASPPCQKHSKMMKATRHDIADYIDFQLYQEIIFLQHFFKGLWIVENVKPYYEPLVKPSLELGRHLIWNNFKITPFKTNNIKSFISKGGQKDSEEMKKWLGIEYEGNLYYEGNHEPCQVLRNAVEPELGLHILNCALGKFNVMKTEQLSLFESK